MAVKTSTLFQNHHFLGFNPINEFDYLDVIRNNHVFLERYKLEDDSSFKQIVSYVILHHPQTNTVYTYQRADNEDDYQVKELFGMYSWGIGGHIKQKDYVGDDPLLNCVKSNILEEVNIDITNIRHVGYINLDHKINLYHFGLLYVVDIASADVVHKVAHIKTSKFRDIVEVLDLSENNQAEDWSQTAVEYLLTIAI